MDMTINSVIQLVTYRPTL